MEAGRVKCSDCGLEVPREPFCICCGAPLADGEAGRRGFAAAPHERWFHPRLVSSIFPHLPRADMRPFRIALVAAGALVVGLCLLNLFPLALVAAAVAVPILFLLYLWDVDVYEDEPLLVIAFTVAWGVVFGTGLGLAAKSLASQVSLLEGSPNTHNAVWLGVILPCAALALTIAGPLVLLPYRKFNDCLDGVTFGACCGATLVAAEAIANSADFLHLGFSAAGNDGLWIARLTTLGVALPVLAAGVGGATCGAFWLRLRRPARDRGVLGPFGSPFLAVPLGAAALVGASLSSLYLRQWETLAVTGILAAAALVWLRWMIDVGLREEAAEKPIGAAVTCPSCRHETPVHTFCGHCGIAFRALPKAGVAHGAGPPRRARLGLGVKVAVFGALAAGAVGLAAIAILLSRPSSSEPPCQPGVPCAAPPAGIPVAAPHLLAGVFQSGTAWTSNLGVGIRYDDPWKLVKSGSTGVVVHANDSNGVFVVLSVTVTPSSVTPQQAISSELSGQQDGFLGIEHDTSADHVILSPELGFVPGIAALYAGTVDQPPSPDEKVEVVFEAARQGKATVVVEAITNEQPHGSSSSSPFPTLQLVDVLLDSLQWNAGT